MERAFWLERWERGETGFHRQDVNPKLRTFWPDLGLAADAPVFVPLCGKSRDLGWLRAQGHPVLGVELSPRAADAFFAESGLVPRRGRRGRFEVVEAEGIRILVGDFFDLTAEDLAGTKAVYDRAALVALAPGDRERYVAHLAAMLAPSTRMLLLTLAYPEGELEGPPFPVPQREVERLYDAYAEVRLLTCEDALPEHQRFAERGVTSLEECAWLLTL